MGNACSGGSSKGVALGGGSPTATPSLDPRTAAAQAAERRAASRAPIDERSRKAELVGRLEAQYKSRGSDAPIGLATFDIPVLEKKLAAMRAGRE